MALRPILRYPDPRLYKKAAPVMEVNDEIRALVRDMAETMYAAPGVGLAATQIDVHKRVIVIDTSETRDKLVVLINPEILAREGSQLCEEGCLSVPGIYEPVERAAWIRARTLTLEGGTHEFEADKLLAVCVQHEMDHLEGKLFIDRISPIARDIFKRKWKKKLKEEKE